MATVVYRFASSSVPLVGGVPIVSVGAPIASTTYLDVTIDNTITSLGDIEAVVNPLGYTLFATNPTIPLNLQTKLTNYGLLQTVAYTSAAAFSSTARATPATNSAAGVVNPSTAGLSVVKAGGSGVTNLLVSYRASGRLTVASTTSLGVRGQVGRTTVNTAATAWTATSMMSGSFAGTGTTNQAWVVAVDWLVTGLAAGQHYFYGMVYVPSAGTISQTSTQITVQEIRA
jgi:hypothetical protein